MFWFLRSEFFCIDPRITEFINGQYDYVVFVMKEKIYEFVKTIPKGKVATYGQIAIYLGNKKMARVVGNILHNNTDPKNIPCHRVVNSNGRLAYSYAFGGLDAQRSLLESEGVVFKNSECVDLIVSQVILTNLN